MFGKCCGRSKKIDQSTQISLEPQNSSNDILQLVNKEEETSIISESAPTIVVNQPAQLTSILKRQSVVSEPKVEEDDEVFSEGSITNVVIIYLMIWIRL